MWSIQQLENIRENAIKDILNIYPDIADKIVKPRIDINHKTTSTICRHSRSVVEFSAYALAGTTDEIFFRTVFMKSIIKQVCYLIEGCIPELVVSNVEEQFPGKYVFEEYADSVKKSSQHVAKRQEDYKYAIICPQCGELFKYKRICKSVLYPELYLCNKCNVPLTHYFHKV